MEFFRATRVGERFTRLKRNWTQANFGFAASME